MVGEDAAWWTDLGLRVGSVFTPNTPIDKRSLFAGRDEQVTGIVDVVNSAGQHAVLFGERGVGKTSLVNVLSELLPNQPDPATRVLAPRVQCDSGDSFKSVWKKVFDLIELARTAPTLGFAAAPLKKTVTAKDLLRGEKITPDSIRRALAIMAQGAIPILIIDEFDRLKPEARRAFADLIKNLSDNAVGATIILVGVGDSVGDLIEEHQSITRALIQIPMPRMRDAEIRAILNKGIRKLGMRIDPAALRWIVLLTQGLPHYAHLMGRHAARTAIEGRSTTITVEHVRAAIKRALKDAQQSVRTAYSLAIRSSRKGNLFPNVLLACALAEVDDLGCFAAQGVREPLQRITGRDYDIPTYAQHLSEFSDEKRGNILCKTGKRYRFRYRFSEPLMQPFVIMEGITRGVVPDNFLAPTRPKPDGQKEEREEEQELGLFEPPAN